jgi:hypothetical protein
VQGDSVTAGGLSALVKQPAAPTPPALPVVETVGTPWAVGYIGSGGSGIYQAGAPAPVAAKAISPAGFPGAFAGASVPAEGLQSATIETFEGVTKLKEFVFNDYYGNTTTSKATGTITAGSAGATSAADFLGWGHWAAGTNTTIDSYSGYSSVSNVNDLHYLVGKPTTQDQMNALQGMTGSYSLIGGTATFHPSYGGGSAIAGSVLSGSATVNFYSGYSYASADITAKFNASTYGLNGISYYTSGAGGKLNGSGGGGMNGILVGNTAQRLGITFSRSVSSGNLISGPDLGLGSVKGAAGFKQDSLVGAGS